MLRECVRSTYGSEVYGSLDAEHTYSVFPSLVKTIYIKHFPFKYIKGWKKFWKPWITPELLDKTKTKRTLSTNNLLLLQVQQETFKSFRNQWARNLSKARDNYHNNCFGSFSGQSRAIWEKLNSVLNRNHMAPIIGKFTKKECRLEGEDSCKKFQRFLCKPG